MPLSTQWGPQGYFYAIQIAQYGLSHYSKNLTERPPHVEVYDTAEERDSRASTAPWSVPKGCSLSRIHDKSRATSARQFSAQGRRDQMAPGPRSLSPVHRGCREARHAATPPQDRMIVCSESQLCPGMTVKRLVPGWTFHRPELLCEIVI